MLQLGAGENGRAIGKRRRVRREDDGALDGVWQFADVSLLFFTLLFIGTLFVGVYLLRNYQRLFGIDPNVPSENGNVGSHNKLLIFVLWLPTAPLRVS